MIFPRLKDTLPDCKSCGCNEWIKKEGIYKCAVCGMTENNYELNMRGEENELQKM